MKAKQKTWKKWISSATMITMLAGTLAQPVIANAEMTVQPVVTGAALPALMITELVPDSKNVSGSDAYEYIEIYNTTDQPINLQDYQLIYHYVDGKGVEQNIPWPLSTGQGQPVMIAGGAAIVLWVKGETIINLEQPLTVQQFNDNYGTALVENEGIFPVHTSGGMSNSGARTLILQDSAGVVISSAAYENDNQTVENKGINYSYPTDGSGRMVMMDGPGTKAATPGVIEPAQLPAGAELPPAIVHSPVTTGSDESNLTISAQITPGSGKPVYAVLYYKNSSATDYKQLVMTESQGSFQAEIPKEELLEAELNYYIEATEGGQTAKTAVYTASIETDDFDYSKVPALLITELLPDSANVAGKSADAYEFVEVYNNTNETVNFKDYQLVYRYTDKGPVDDVHWLLENEGDILIPSRQSIVIWMTNADNGGYTADDFNANFGTSLTLDGTLFRTKTVSGMANGSARGMLIKSAAGAEISIASYQNDDQTKPDKGIHYAYPLDGTLNMRMLPGAGELAATPGSLTTEQQPAQTVQLPDSTPDTPLAITETKHQRTNEGFEVSAVVASPKQDEVGAKLYYKTAAQVKFISLPMSGTNGNYKALIPAAAASEDTLVYYVEASAGGGLAKSAFYPITVNEDQVDTQKAPIMLITELVPDSTNVGGGDGYEFVEIYNNTNLPINLKDYKINYRYTDSGPGADVIWPTDKEDVELAPGATAVFWVINNYNQAVTADQFNANYGTNLTEGVNLFRMYSDGMANGGKRALVIATNSGIEIAAAYYDNDEETKADKGIFYKYPVGGVTTMVKYSAGLEKATPGSVLKGQAPLNSVQLSVDTTKPVANDLTDVTEINQSAKLKLTVSAEDDQLARTVVLYYKSDLQDEYTKRNLKVSYDDGLYSHTLFSPELIGRGYIDYYFEVSDGVNMTATETKRVAVLGGPDRSELRLNVQDDEVLSGSTILRGTGELATAAELKLSIDGKELTDGTYHALESDAYFAFEVQGADYYFKNAIVQNKEILHTFLDPIPSWSTLTIPISADRLQEGSNVLSIYAGSKSGPFDDRPEENKDDFEIRNIRLVLADGTELYDPTYSSKTASIKMGDSAGKHEHLDFNFTLDAARLMSKAYLWDTMKVADGEHTIALKSGAAEPLVRIVKVDNTDPVIVPSIENGKEHRGVFTIDAKISDEIAGVQKTAATLDGQDIELPFATSSAKLAPGEHTLRITALDKVGNEAVENITFTVPDENPLAPELVGPTAGQSLNGTTANLSVKVSDPLLDSMKVTFYRGFKYDASAPAGFTAYRHAADTEPPKELAPAGEAAFVQEDYDAISAVDGKYLVDDSMEKFPYQRFEIKLDPSVKDTDLAQIRWKGKSLEGRMVSLYAWSEQLKQWEMLDTTIAGNEDFELAADVEAGKYRSNNTIQVMVQDQLPVSDDPYDFSFVWMSDTQYYSESYPEYYRDNVAWIKNNLEKHKIRYVIHTGDIVDEADKLYQWEEADRNMKVLDDANIPYGVLAGNHDVSHQFGTYDEYWKWFGEDRFKKQPTYGGSYKNNMGHYDLVSAGGNDFIIVYMGWGLGDQDIEWMDEIVKKYPNRKAILAFHEYLLVSGNRSPIADKIYEKVVLPNPNVFATLSGHYHDAELKTDEVDDNGDGIADRKVYQMLADYQGAEDGGLGYIRLMQFDMSNNKLHIKTYSPTLDDYNYYDPTEFPGKDEFSLDLNLEGKLKRVATDYFSVNVYTDQLIGISADIASGKEASAVWNSLSPNQQYEWYAVAEDRYDGLGRSDIWNFNTGEGSSPTPTPKPEVTPTPTPGATSTPGVTPTPVATPTPPANGEKVSINVEAAADGRYVVQPSVIAKALETGAADTVIELVLVDSGEGSAELALDTESVQALKQSGRSIRITTNQVKLDIPAGAMPNLGSDVSTLHWSIQTSSDAAALDADKAAAESDGTLTNSGILYTFELYSVNAAGNKLAIHNFAEAIQVAGELTSEEEASFDPDYAGIYYLNAGQAEYMGGTFKDGQITFQTDHFSDFAIMEYRKAFTDTMGHWGQDFIGKLAAKHAVSGVDDRRYMPDKAITRADFAVIAVRALGYLEPKVGSSTFSDVEAGKYYAAYVEQAYELGLVAGYQGKFRPDAEITREEAAVILMKLDELLNQADSQQTASPAFADIHEAASWSRSYIEAAQELGYLKGKGSNRFEPKSLVTRAEIATMVWKALD